MCASSDSRKTANEPLVVLINLPQNGGTVVRRALDWSCGFVPSLSRFSSEKSALLLWNRLLNATCALSGPVTLCVQWPIRGGKMIGCSTYRSRIKEGS